jgi:hypothetical protein
MIRATRTDIMRAQTSEAYCIAWNTYSALGADEAIVAVTLGDRGLCLGSIGVPASGATVTF